MSAQAIALIENCLKTKDQYLDIGCCGLRDEDFKEGSVLDTLLRWCTHITTLILSDNWLAPTDRTWKKSKNKGDANKLATHPPAVLRLTQLTGLACGGDYKTAWALKSMAFVATLTNLRWLYLAYNHIQEIEGLDALVNLQSFDISYNQITELTGLDALTNLQNFYISNNQISELKGLDALANLRYFYIGGNQISELKGLDALAKLA